MLRFGDLESEGRPALIHYVAVVTAGALHSIFSRRPTPASLGTVPPATAVGDVRRAIVFSPLGPSDRGRDRWGAPDFTAAGRGNRSSADAQSHSIGAAKVEVCRQKYDKNQTK